MSFLFEFPHTRTYDGDLGWLIKKFVDLVNYVNELEQQVDSLNKLYENIPQRIQDAIDAEIAKMEATLEAELAKVQKALDDQLAAVNTEFNIFRSEFNVIQSLVQNMEQHLMDVKAFAQAAYINGRIYTDTEIEQVYLYLEYRLKNINKEWPLIQDPTDGNMETVQTVVNHLWAKSGHGIRVEVFDALKIPVEEFDKMQIPVSEFDYNGDYIFGERKYSYMISPFNGRYVPIAEVIYDLYNLHYPDSGKVKVEDFDAAQIPVEKFDAANIEVITFGTTNQWFKNLTEEN